MSETPRTPKKESATTGRGFGQEPLASPAARSWAVILGVVLLALAGVAGRETWLVSAQANARSWIDPFIDLVAAGTLRPWMLWAGGASIALGILLVIISLKPRRHTHLRVVADNASVWMRPVDIARLASASARREPGVAAARTQVKKKRKSVKVDVVVNGDVEDATLGERVHETIAQELSSLQAPAQISVAVDQIPELDSNV